MADWWVDLYDDLLAEVFLLPEDGPRVARTVDFLSAVLELSEGDRILDQCCGTGRLAVPLAERGYEVVGVDQAARYIARARAHPPLELIVGDARDHVARPPVDAAFNWWTSFGYAERDEDNRRMIQAAVASLRVGGRFALDTMNVPQVLRAFRPEDRCTVETSKGPLQLLRVSELDLAGGYLRKRWRYERAGAVVERESRVRLYMPHELVGFFEGEGLTDVRCYGDEWGAPLTSDSPRCIVVGTRSAGG